MSKHISIPQITQLFAYLALSLSILGCNAKVQGYMGFDANINYRMVKAVNKLLCDKRVEEEFSKYENISILVPSVADIRSLDESSRLGTTLSEYLVNAFVAEGYLLKEIKMAEKVSFTKGGEYLLSRDINHLVSTQDADFLVTGTYTIGKNVVYLNLRLTRSQDNVILSAVETKLPLGSETRTLLELEPYKYN